MTYLVIKTIAGRRYVYQQQTYREGKRVRTRTVYLGPADGGVRRRRPGILAKLHDLIEANSLSPEERAMYAVEKAAERAARDGAARAASDRAAPLARGPNGNAAEAKAESGAISAQSPGSGKQTGPVAPAENPIDVPSPSTSSASPGAPDSAANGPAAEAAPGSDGDSSSGTGGAEAGDAGVK